MKEVIKDKDRVSKLTFNESSISFSKTATNNPVKKDTRKNKFVDPENPQLLDGITRQISRVESSKYSRSRANEGSLNKSEVSISEEGSSNLIERGNTGHHKRNLPTG